MKTIIATLLLSAALARGVTITFNADTSTVLDFNVEWGERNPPWMIPSGGFGVGPSGSTVQWLSEISRNINYFFVEIHDAFEGFKPRGFGINFWTDPEYTGFVPTAYGSPNILIGALNYPLDWTPYGARIVVPVTSVVPEGGVTAWLLVFGLAGLVILWSQKK